MGLGLAEKAAVLCWPNPYGKRRELEDEFICTQTWVALESITYQCPQLVTPAPAEHHSQQWDGCSVSEELLLSHGLCPNKVEKRRKTAFGQQLLSIDPARSCCQRSCGLAEGSGGDAEEQQLGSWSALSTPVLHFGRQL
ncbi:hypothetical protein llap_650 [Limosa lapponica baueri]|uniref:Uncharacterized protein n=1 Tax=Limosa lapponica baueri TaxID=1758121 RepID=A0A2I0USG8_LIMLA|nr:hypothetical protein llap_650 [Limosa lapponica baueri]